MKYIKLLICCTLVTGMLFGTNSFAAPVTRTYLLSTASTGGTYYPVGVALATLIKVKLQPKQKIGLSAINSAGSGENIMLLAKNEVQFAILQGLFGYYAWNGVGPITKQGPQKELRSITMLWPNVEHYVIKSKFVKTGTITDLVNLKGHPMSLGKRNSGTIGSNTLLLSRFGINVEKDYTLIRAGYGPTVEAFQNGQIDGAGMGSGVPGNAVTRIAATAGTKMTVLEFTDDQALQADGGLNLWTRYIIPAGTYPGQEKEIRTIAQPNFLAVRADVDDDAVYQITKTIYENLSFLNAIHGATKAMAIEKAISGLPMPLHPGAARYYQEVGITIPERLIAH